MSADVESIVDGFRRLALAQGLSKKSKTYKNTRAAYLEQAVLEGFSSVFGSGVEKLQAWQNLCWTVRAVDDESAASLTSIKKCKAALAGIYVNLIDLVDAGNAGQQISRTFTSAKSLAQYIRRTKKVFPKHSAKSNKLLRQFLIVVE